MNRTMTCDSTMLAGESWWMAKPGAGTVEVRAVLGALVLRRAECGQFRETVIEAQGSGQDSVTVDAVKLAGLLKALGAKGERARTTIDIDDDGVAIEVGGRAGRLRAAIGAESVPWRSFTPTGQPSAVLTGDQIARALTSVGTDDYLPTLTGVLFDGGSMVSTDRFALTWVTYAESGFRALVPGAVLRAFIDRRVVLVELGDDALVRCSADGRSIVAELMDADFPKWRGLIPSDPAVSALLRRDDLLAAARGNQVTLTLNDDTMTVSSTDGDDIELTQGIDVTGATGAPFTVKLATGLLSRCLRAIDCGAVTISATAPDKPVMLTDVGGRDTHLVMPVR